MTAPDTFSVNVSPRGNVWIGVPRDLEHGLQVALAPCPCGASKSHATTELRAAFADAIKRGIAQRDQQRRTQP